MRITRAALLLTALALPSYIALIRWLGAARGLALFLLFLSLLPLVNTALGGLVFLLATLRAVAW